MSSYLTEKEQTSSPTVIILPEFKLQKKTSKAVIMQIAIANFEANLVQQFGSATTTKYSSISEHRKKIQLHSEFSYLQEPSAILDFNKANLKHNNYFYSIFLQSTYSLPPVSQILYTSTQLDSLHISEKEVYHTLTKL